MSTTNLTQEENFDQAIRDITISVGVDPLSEGTTRITTMIDTMITKQDHHTSQTKTNPGSGEVTTAIHNRLEHRDKIHPSLTSAVTPDQIHLIPQCLAYLETKTWTKKYDTIRNSNFQQR